MDIPLVISLCIMLTMLLIFSTLVYIMKLMIKCESRYTQQPLTNA